MSLFIENTASGSLVSLEGIGGKQNEGGTYDVQSTDSLLLPFASLLTSVNNSGSKIQNRGAILAVGGGLVDTPELTRREGGGDWSM